MTRRAPFALTACLIACGGGSAWMAEPLPPDDPQSHALPTARPYPRPTPAVVADAAAPPDVDDDAGPDAPPLKLGGDGRVVGVFRNTYYDFPREAGYAGGGTLSLMSGTCTPIAQVPRAFYEAVCVQGSGTLRRGETVSFARRDCECAEVCPRTGHRICFDALDAARFPWGRGAAGRAIAPMISVAADTSVLALGTAIYIPDFDGVPRAAGSTSRHDGCFVVEDRGTRVQGAHVDVFTGDQRNTAFFNQIVPSNKGVTVIVGAKRCDGPRPRG